VQTAQACSGFIGIERRVQKCRRDAAGLQRVHLVFHQRNQRRDDDRETVAREGGKLKAKRFATTGRQQREDVPARERILDDLLLQRPE